MSWKFICPNECFSALFTVKPLLVGACFTMGNNFMKRTIWAVFFLRILVIVAELSQIFPKYQTEVPFLTTQNVILAWISHFWGKPKEIAEGLGLLLLIWNQAFYRYCRFDFNKLEKFLLKDKA